MGQCTSRFRFLGEIGLCRVLADRVIHPVDPDDDGALARSVQRLPGRSGWRRR
jgi:hypothetical protein